jgi:hypothetical protein
LILLAAPGKSAFTEAAVDRLANRIAAAALGVKDTGGSVDRDRSSTVRARNLERELLNVYSSCGTLDRDILNQRLTSTRTDIPVNNAVIHLEQSGR